MAKIQTEQKYYLSLNNAKSSGLVSIGIEDVVADYLPRVGDLFQFEVSDLEGVRGYEQRGWTRETIEPFWGTYMVEMVRHKLTREGNSLKTQVYVHAKKNDKWV